MIIRVDVIILITSISQGASKTAEETIVGVSTKITGIGASDPTPTQPYPQNSRGEEDIRRHQNIAKEVLLLKATGGSTTVNVCELPIEEGQCYANFLYWGYQKDTNACVAFHYGGCDGNDNRFVTVDECIQSCVRVIDKVDNMATEVPH